MISVNTGMGDNGTESLLIFVSYIFAFLQMKLFFIPLYVL